MEFARYSILLDIATTLFNKSKGTSIDEPSEPASEPDETASKNVNVNLIYHALSYTSTKPCYVVYRHATETRETDISNKRNKDKNLNWQETKLDRGFELGTTEKQIPLVARGRP